MKCKVFATNRNNLENDVNYWLESNKNIEILNVIQTESDQNGYITLTIFYLDKNEIRLKKLDKINKLSK